jgi:hypothetical protein
MKYAQIPDVRTRGSLADICESIANRPGMPFSPTAGPAGCQAFARLPKPGDPTGAPPVGPAELLSGHAQQTARRGGAYPLLLVAQDTTDLQFPSSPLVEGLGPTGTHRHTKGLLAHSALALSPTGTPLGVLHLALWHRDPAQFGGTKTRRQRDTAEKESQKWLDGVTAVEAALPPEQAALVIQDREGDVFALLAQARRPNTHLLLRAAQNRNVEWCAPEGSPQRGYLFSVAAAGDRVGSLTVSVPRRRDADAQQVELAVRVVEVQVQPPLHRKASAAATPQRVTILQAREEAPPAGEAPIEWVLVTTLPVPDVATAITVVGYYACRWRIERLHYTLKSGLHLEELQHESRTTLDRAIALYYLVAWRLLWLTYVAREHPTAAASEVFTAAEIRILGGATRRKVRTAAEAQVALGVLGGYRPYRKALPPGVKVLWRGYQRLQDALLGYDLRAAGT